MISAEAPTLFAKACEIFIEELTLRAWTHAEENKRRTIQKSDISTAVSKSDMYDFLIDIVPRGRNNRPSGSFDPSYAYASAFQSEQDYSSANAYQTNQEEQLREYQIMQQQQYQDQDKYLGTYGSAEGL